jgi:NAD+ kinase
MAFERLALVIHPTRPVGGARGTIERWASEHGLGVVRLGDGDTAAPGDLVVALGGDGTVLAALRAAAPAEASVLGVACGSLGALTAVTADQLARALEHVRAGEWTGRPLPALAIEASEAATAWAVNDFVVVRRGGTQVLADVSVDGALYVRLAGDGVIVATPLGSSAYTMASGGPLLVAGTRAFVCTPLAMHGGSAPPLVVPATATLQLEIQPSYGGFELELDGRRRAAAGAEYRISLHPDKVTIIGFDEPRIGLGSLRRRGLITDSPRVLARDARGRA